MKKLFAMFALVSSFALADVYTAADPYFAEASAIADMLGATWIGDGGLERDYPVMALNLPPMSSESVKAQVDVALLDAKTAGVLTPLSPWYLHETGMTMRIYEGEAGKFTVAFQDSQMALMFEPK